MVALHAVFLQRRAAFIQEDAAARKARGVVVERVLGELCAAEFDIRAAAAALDGRVFGDCVFDQAGIAEFYVDAAAVQVGAVLCERIAVQTGVAKREQIDAAAAGAGVAGDDVLLDPAVARFQIEAAAAIAFAGAVGRVAGQRVEANGCVTAVVEIETTAGGPPDVAEHLVLGETCGGLFQITTAAVNGLVGLEGVFRDVGCAGAEITAAAAPVAGCGDQTAITGDSVAFDLRVAIGHIEACAVGRGVGGNGVADDLSRAGVQIETAPGQRRGAVAVAANRVELQRRVAAVQI